MSQAVEFSRRTVVSADGTVIGFRQVGSGPGLIILHGGLESSGDYTDLAADLGSRFTVFSVDRRGRGMSGPHGPDYMLCSEIDDVAAVLSATGARYLFGVSSGASLALACTLRLSAVQAVAAYEPALRVPGQGSEEYVGRYEREVSEGDLAGALLTLLKGARIGPRFLRYAPRPIAKRLVEKLLLSDAPRDSEPEEVPFSTLIPTMRYDIALGNEASQYLDRFNTMDRPVLLLGGSKSPRDLVTTLDFLEESPGRQRIRFRGLGHTGASNRAQGGRPEIVAVALADFFVRQSD